MNTRKKFVLVVVNHNKLFGRSRDGHVQCIGKYGRFRCSFVIKRKIAGVKVKHKDKFPFQSLYLMEGAEHHFVPYDVFIQPLFVTDRNVNGYSFLGEAVSEDSEGTGGGSDGGGNDKDLFGSVFSSRWILMITQFFEYEIGDLALERVREDIPDG
jgi:hypothetical protein